MTIDKDDFKADGFAGIEIRTGEVYMVKISDIGGSSCYQNINKDNSSGFTVDAYSQNDCSLYLDLQKGKMRKMQTLRITADADAISQDSSFTLAKTDDDFKEGNVFEFPVKIVNACEDQDFTHKTTNNPFSSGLTYDIGDEATIVNWTISDLINETIPPFCTLTVDFFEEVVDSDAEGMVSYSDISETSSLNEFSILYEDTEDVGTKTFFYRISDASHRTVLESDYMSITVTYACFDVKYNIVSVFQKAIYGKLIHFTGFGETTDIDWTIDGLIKNGPIPDKCEYTVNFMAVEDEDSIAFENVIVETRSDTDPESAGTFSISTEDYSDVGTIEFKLEITIAGSYVLQSEKMTIIIKSCLDGIESIFYKNKTYQAKYGSITEMNIEDAFTV